MLEKKHLIKEKKVKYANTERDILTKCGDHPNIVKLFYTFSDEQYLCIFFNRKFSELGILDSLDYVLELCPNGELLGQLKKVTNSSLLFIIDSTFSIVHLMRNAQHFILQK
jgi:serine/threonine protein kinase